MNFLKREFIKAHNWPQNLRHVCNSVHEVIRYFQ